MRVIGRLTCFLFLALGSLGMLSSLTIAQSGSKRLALIVANAAYKHTPELLNPANDAEMIAQRLRTLGFKVSLKRDLDARGFAEALREFAGRLDKQTDALFYYAGHGLQFSGENFFVGVDARMKSRETLQFETFKLNDIVDSLESRAGTSLFFWDACRDNPLADVLNRSAARATVRTAGLSRSGAAPIPERLGDVLLYYSAAPDQVALDGAGRFSPFAEALGKHIDTPNVEIEVMLKRVQADVGRATGRRQRPERLSRLEREFYFNPSKVQVAAQDELRKLRARLAALEAAVPRPINRTRFRIVGTDDAEFHQVVAVTTRTVGTAGRNDKSPSTGVRTRSSPPATHSVGQSAALKPTVVIAVDKKSSALIRRLRLSPDGQVLAVGDDEGNVRIVRLDRFEVVRTIDAHEERISDLDFSPDSQTLLSAGRDGPIKFWSVNSGKLLRTLQAKAARPYSARLNPAFPDRWVIMGDERGFLYAWDLRKNQIITETKLHAGSVYAVGYQPQGKGAYFSAGSDGLVKVRLPEGERFTVKAHDETLRFAAYSNDGRLFYTGGDDHTAKIWSTGSLRQGKPDAVFEGHLKYILAADMSLDGNMLATGGGDKVLNLWDVKERKLVGRLKGHTNDIEAISFAPNGKFVVSASEDKSVRIWSVETREELVRLFFQANGDKFVGVTYDNQLFGDRNSGLVTIYADGREVVGKQADELVRYVGHGIAIIR